MEQAKRLCELQEYIMLCEKKIKLLVPAQEFPLNEKNFVFGLNQDESHNKEIENLNQIIRLKEEVLS